MRMIALVCAILFIAAFVSALPMWSPPAGAEEGRATLTVFAAASLNDAMTEVGKLYTEKTGTKVEFNFASSGILARQIEQGARADCFVSASLDWAKTLHEGGFLPEYRTLLSNTLVLIAPAAGRHPQITFEAGFDFSATFAGRLAIGDPEHVPAGKYAMQALESLRWDKGIKERLITGKDVRETLRIVEIGGADMGIVYGGDARQAKGVQVLGIFPAATHPPIDYPAGVLANAAPEAADFMTFLFTPEVGEILMRYGFHPAGEAVKSK